MRMLWILLPVLAQGAFGALFKEQPPGQLVVHRGDEVTLPCVTNEDVQCAWKLEAPRLSAKGFLTMNIPSNLEITARNPGSKRDCTITIRNVDERYNGEYKCSPFVAEGGQEDSAGTELIIAQKPKSVRYLGEAAQGFPMLASTKEPNVVQCLAEMARPKAEIVWYLGTTQLYEKIEVQDSQVNATGLWNSVSTLTYQFHKEDNGKSLRCLASHAGYDKNDAADQDARETAVDVDVMFAAYRPGGNNIGKLYGFTAGQPGEITVNFTANPVPGVMYWKVGDTVKVPAGGTDRLDRRFTSGTIIIKNATLGMYALKLTIDPVTMEDQSKNIVLHLENNEGVTSLEFQIGTGAAPPPAAPLGATIGGIVAAVVVLAIIIGVVVFGRSRGKWCFAGKANAKGKGKDTVDGQAPAARPRPLKAPRPSASVNNVNRGGGAGAGGGGGVAARRNSLPVDGRRRSSRGPGAGKMAMPFSLAALKQSMSARPNKRRLGADDGSVEVGLEEVTYVGHAPAAGEADDDVPQTPASQPLVQEGAPTPVPAVAEEPATPAPSGKLSAVDIPELEAPPRSARAVEADLDSMPKEPPTPITPIMFPTSQPPAAMSSPMSSELDSPASSRGESQYPPSQTRQPFRIAQQPRASPMGPPVHQKPSQMGPPGYRPMGPPLGPPGSGPQPGSPSMVTPRDSDPADWRGAGRPEQGDRWGSGPIGPGLYSNTAGPALPERNPSHGAWSPPAGGRQRTTMAPPPSDSPRYPMGAPRGVELPPAGSREELGIPYPPPGVVMRPGPPLPPKSRPQSQIPAGAKRVLPDAMRLEMAARFPSSPSVLDPIGDGSAV